MQSLQPGSDNYSYMEMPKTNREILNTVSPVLPPQNQFFEKINNHHTIMSSPSLFRTWETPYLQDHSQVGSENEFEYRSLQDPQNIMEYSKFPRKEETCFADISQGEIFNLIPFSFFLCDNVIDFLVT